MLEAGAPAGEETGTRTIARRPPRRKTNETSVSVRRSSRLHRPAPSKRGRSRFGSDPSGMARERPSYRWRSLYFSMSSFWMLAGTSPYLANSIVYSALPCVAERSSVE